jgi:hypothetical protein
MSLATAPSIGSRPEVRAGGIRPLTPADLPAVARLHAVAFPDRRMRGAELDTWLSEIFCGHPWQDPALPSLVYESRPGDVVGCLGVMPRPMLFRGRPITAAISHHFMVEPGQRATMAAVHLVRAFLAGPQQLSLAEGNALSRKFWEGLHAATSFAYSLHWMRPIRPAAYAASFGTRGWKKLLARIGSPVAAALDAVMKRGTPGERSDTLRAADLDAATLAAAIDELRGDRALMPRYDPASLHWFLQLLAGKRSSGTLQQVALRDRHDRVGGWFLYYLRRDRASEVLQIGARPEYAAAAFDQLISHATAKGALALTGRLEPSWMPVLADRRVLFRAGASWMLLHASNREIVDAIHRGDAFLSPLEGEWWMSA